MKDHTDAEQLRSFVVPFFDFEEAVTIGQTTVKLQHDGR
jgi:hypothetical protein